ncbi:unnamed protein product [Rotaria magnacalcarata]|uniref:Uncharacterized protein n=1 Tax=Rotaria magnacalcarata TaxID=392030 RepID=A0A819ITS6_9BILA|nr:unnamed protein product [Rotaria magnacalcarata]
MWYSVASPMDIRGKPSSINQHNERSMTTHDVANICDTWIRTIYSIKLRQKRDNTSSVDIKVIQTTINKQRLTMSDTPPDWNS